MSKSLKRLCEENSWSLKIIVRLRLKNFLSGKSRTVDNYPMPTELLDGLVTDIESWRDRYYGYEASDFRLENYLRGLDRVRRTTSDRSMMDLPVPDSNLFAYFCVVVGRMNE